MNPITNFVFDAQEGDARPVRVLMIDDEPWFVATDVAAVLGYRDAANMVRMLDEDEAATHNLSIRSENGVEQDREVSIISESGLYAAILKSRRPEAKAFKKWVTAQVLPGIRKTGAYVEPGAQLGQGGGQPVQFLSHGADILVAADRTFRGAMRSARSAGLPLHRALRQANEVCIARTGIDMIAELDAHDRLTPAPPKADPGGAQQVPAHLTAFMAALNAGEIGGAALPMLSTQLFRLYQFWCRSVPCIPLAQSRFGALMAQAGAYRTERKRYRNAAGETIGPNAFAFGLLQQVPADRFEPEWLGEAVESAYQALSRLSA